MGWFIGNGECGFWVDVKDGLSYFDGFIIVFRILIFNFVKIDLGRLYIFVLNFFIEVIIKWELMDCLCSGFIFI